MSKKRIYEYAKEKNMTSKEMLEAIEKAGLSYSSHMATMTGEDVRTMDRYFQTKTNDQAGTPSAKSNSGQKHHTNNRHSQSAQSKEQATADKKRSHHKADKKHQNGQPAKAKKSANQSSERQHQPNKTQNAAENHADRKNNKRNKKKNRKNRQQKRNEQPNYNMRKTIHHDQPNKSKGSKELPDKIEYTEGMTVAELAKKMHRSPADIIKKLFTMGVMATQNDSLDSDAIELVLAEYGIEAERKVEIDRTDFDVYFEEAKDTPKEEQASRPPVITIMGHVDHGKTTLLDYLRNADVAEGEAGGITQHIGAYQVKVGSDDRVVTFLDTPGHEAFTTMRARGADVTDIVVIVVAADDGVKPQTVEAINHAKAAGVPIIVAINKMDRPGANPERVKQEMMEYELVPEEWGGDTIFVEISAKFGQNIDELLEMIVLVADMQELKAVSDRLAMGTVVEARLDPHRGSVATVLVQYGTLNHGDAIVAGNTFGRVRTMTNDQGRRIHKAGPSTPVEITGLQEAPQPGDRFVILEDEKTARAIGEERAMRAQEARRNQTHKVTLDNLFETLQEGELKTVNVVLKADVQGSVEAIKGSLDKIDVEGVKVDIIHAGVGAVNESDVTLADASNAIIIGFNVRPTANAKTEAESDETDIRLYNVIYDLIADVESAMKGQLEPEYKEESTGEVVIRETYKVSDIGTIGGGYVTSGYIKRDSQIRIYRNDVKIYEGVLGSLRRYKDDVKEVTKGFECGLTVENYNDIKVDDVIEAYHMVEIKPGE
ncbi:MAG: translation initiation factor IF-2 [Aerococcus sp.]|nr:translation initiation factor IF-2 [Aerococcus sp.]